jgi:hypothetical protein
MKQEGEKVELMVLPGEKDGTRMEICNLLLLFFQGEAGMLFRDYFRIK